MNSNLTPRFLVLAGLILVAAFTRLIPHPPNFTAIGAMALFGGAYFDKKYLAFAVPLTAMFLSDLIIGFHPGMYAVYLSFIFIVMIGMTLRDKKKIGNIILASVSASVLFFIITNFALWLTGNLYPKTALGLAACFTAAIPFFHYTLLGDLFFAGVLFGAFELLKVKFPEYIKVKA
ncbi:MAG TPA: DUF6580 family putative transport protein [Ignavibacteriaceae bacterium]|nr:DUF6580 family putative transport protein [Ignavibacteriaceae bacterium]